MLFSDIALPFLVALLHSSVPDLLFDIYTGHSNSSGSDSSSYSGSIDAVRSCSSSSDDNTCLSSDGDVGMGMSMGVGIVGHSGYPFESGLLVAQLVVVVLMVFIRWSSLQAHLQTHLDSLVHLVAAQIIAPNVSEESIASLQLKVKVRSDGLSVVLIVYLLNHLSIPSSIPSSSLYHHHTHHLSHYHHSSSLSISSALYWLPDGCYLPVRRSAPIRCGVCSATASEQSHRHRGVLWPLQPSR